MQPMPYQPTTQQAALDATVTAVSPPVPPEPATALALWPTFMRRTLSDALLEAPALDSSRGD